MAAYFWVNTREIKDAAKNARILITAQSCPPRATGTGSTRPKSVLRTLNSSSKWQIASLARRTQQIVRSMQVSRCTTESNRDSEIAE